jgi:diguanylate cyclase (GGDEF)-like protein
MRLTKRILSNRVSQRIVILFISTAIIPLLLLAGLTLYQVRSQLMEQHSDAVRISAKMIGMNIFQRLQYTKDELQLIAESLHAGYRPALKTLKVSDNNTSQQKAIETLFLLSNQGEISALTGGADIDGPSLIKQVHAQRIPGKAMLLLSAGSEDGSPPTLFLFIPLNNEDPMGKLLGARLHIPSLIDSQQLNVRRELICILNENGIPIYCNKPYQMPWLANLAARITSQNTQQLNWSTQDHQQLLTAYWSLFLKPHYQVKKWSVAVAMPSHEVMASVYKFQKIFIQVGIITLSLVILLSIFTIRRNMVPLEQLLEGTRRLAKGAFSTRVEINSKDEFEELGNAFNDMTVKLGNSFDQQAGLIDLSYKLQHAGILHKALNVALDALPHFVIARGMALIHVESSGEFIHTEALARLDQKTSEHSASYPHTEMQLPHSPWKGEVSQAVRLLPPIDRLGLGADTEIQLLPALVKDHVVAYVVLYLREPETPSMERLFILTQFCDILATSLSNIRLHQRLEYQAHHDPLTKLPNRTLIKHETERALEHAAAHQHQLAIMIMDIDRFKTINDSMGHASGDELLVQLAERLNQFTSRRDIVSRFAGDEFVFLFASNDCALHKQLPNIIQRLDRVFMDPFILGNRRVRISASKGIAFYPGDGDSFLDLLKNADAAMYQAKHQKPGSYTFFSEALQLSLVDELETEQDLIDALTEKAFELHYQPCIHLPTGQVVGAEALIRWRHPTRGLLPPQKFIRIAEMTGLIEPIGNWVLKHACDDFLRWQQSQIELNYVSVNVSSVQLKNPDFVSTVKQILQNSGMPPNKLELEITETAFIEDFDDSLDKLQQIRQLGVTVAVDDFGTGYASLKYLKQLPADRIKIDRLFIKDLPESQNDIAIISSLITLTDQLGLGLLAEGIETEAQKRHLIQAGIQFAQGFLMSRPLPDSELRAYCEAHASPTASAVRMR